MATQRGSTLVELVVGLVIVVAIFAVFLIDRGRAQRTARAMKSPTNVRDIHTALVQFAQSNNGYFPGMDSKGTRLEDYSVEFRFQQLLEGQFLTGKDLVSRVEIVDTVWVSGHLTAGMYSFALLNLSDEKSPRLSEWKDTANANAPVLSDRAVANKGQGTIRSILAKPRPDTSTDYWFGQVGFNDGHVQFERTHDSLTTTYGKGASQRTFANDNLFDTTGASMVYSGNDLLIDPREPKPAPPMKRVIQNRSTTQPSEP